MNLPFNRSVSKFLRLDSQYVRANWWKDDSLIVLFVIEILKFIYYQLKY